MALIVQRDCALEIEGYSEKYDRWVNDFIYEI